MPVEHLSHSSINTFMMCSWRWKLRYVDKLPERKSEALMFGSAWHKMISLVLGGEEEINRAWSLAFNRQLEEVDAAGDWFIEYDILGQRMLQVESVKSTIENLIDLDINDIERQITLDIPGLSIPVIGYIDLIVNGTPVDFKTAGRKWTQAQADQSLQPTFYLAALNQAGEVKLPKIFEYIIFTKTKSPQVQVIETLRTAADVFRLFDLVCTVWNAIQKGAFTPNTQGWHCSEKYCGMWEHCKWGGKQ